MIDDPFTDPLDDDDCPDVWHLSLGGPDLCPTCGAGDGVEPEWWSTY